MTQRTSMDPALDAFTRRNQQRNHEKNNPPGLPDLFAPPAEPVSVQPVPSPDERYARWLEATKLRLAVLAKAMLADAGEAGVSFDDVRIAAETRGILTGNEEGRTLSFGSAMMRSLGAVPGEYVKSRHRNSNGRTVRKWRLKVYANIALPGE